MPRSRYAMPKLRFVFNILPAVFRPRRHGARSPALLFDVADAPSDSNAVWREGDTFASREMSRSIRRASHVICFMLRRASTSCAIVTLRVQWFKDMLRYRA